MCSLQAMEKEAMVQCLTNIFDNFRLDSEAIAYWHNSDKKETKIAHMKNRFDPWYIAERL